MSNIIYNGIKTTVNYINQTKIGNTVYNKLIDLASKGIIKYNNIINSNDIKYCAYIEKITNENGNYINRYYKESTFIFNCYYKLYKNNYSKCIDIIGNIYNEKYKDKLMIIKIKNNVIFYNFDSIQNLFKYLDTCEENDINNINVDTLIYTFSIQYLNNDEEIVASLNDMMNKGVHNTINNIIDFITSANISDEILNTEVFDNEDISQYNIKDIIQNNYIKIKRFDIISEEEKVYNLNNLDHYIKNNVHIVDIIYDLIINDIDI